MATRAETEQVILDKIHELAANTSSPSVLLKIAEAYAWMAAPNNAHGADVNVGK